MFLCIFFFLFSIKKALSNISQSFPYIKASHFSPICMESLSLQSGKLIPVVSIFLGWVIFSFNTIIIIHLKIRGLLFFTWKIDCTSPVRKALLLGSKTWPITLLWISCSVLKEFSEMDTHYVYCVKCPNEWDIVKLSWD